MKKLHIPFLSIPITAFLLIPSFLGAAGWTDIRGVNGRGEMITMTHQENVVVQRQGEEESYVQSFVADFVITKGNDRKEFKGVECIFSSRADGNSWMTCSSKNGAPLGGATYHHSPKAKTGHYVCIRNCTDMSPKTLKADPWE